jgi:hypothetical protein
MTERDNERDKTKADLASAEYERFLGRKVAAARATIRAGLHFSNEEIEAEFAARRYAAMTSSGA